MCKCLQKDLDLTTKLLANTEDELRLSKYSLKERDFIISEQKKAGISWWKPVVGIFLYDV